MADFGYQELMNAMPQQQQQSLWDGLQNAPVPYAYPLAPQQTNLPQANAEMNLSPQEQALYMRHITNLYGPGGVNNPPTAETPGGSRSTLFVNTFGMGDRTNVIPSIWNGKILSPDASLANARREGLEKFPSYASQGEADARYGRMHDFMEKDTGDYFRNKD